MSISLSTSDVLYLGKCAAELGFGYGIIIGQHSEPEKYIVVHLAKNCEEEVEVLEKPDESGHDVQGPQNIGDINIHSLTTQWISACKMCPGSFHILGIFVTGAKADIIEEKTFNAAKTLLHNLHSLLVEGSNFCGSTDDIARSNFLFLVYSAAVNKAICKSFANNSNGGSFLPMDCYFVEKSFEWYTFECCYELDDLFPILDETQKINIEHQFHRTIVAMKRNLSACEIFIQNESVDDSLSVEVYVQRKSGSKKREQDENYKVTIFLPVKCQSTDEYPVKVRKFNGTIRFSGVISSRIWCNAKNTLGDVKRFLRDDILRSLAARIQVYCDGLTDPHVSNDSVFISEPPRRVFFNLFNNNVRNTIQFSEYIFRGEAPTVAVAQAKQILDLEINTENIMTDLEGLPDDETFSDISSPNLLNVPSQSTILPARDLARSMYLLGITVSLLVLLVSILLHYLLQ